MPVEPTALVALALAGLWIALLAAGLWGVRRTVVVVPKLEILQPPASVSVFVPARNEVEVVGVCLRALCEQGPSVKTIVAIDDQSTDGTAEEIQRLAEQHASLRFLQGSGPEADECGKPAALRLAVRSARPETEWLLFVDADVVLAPGAVPALLQAADIHGADLVSALPRLEMVRPVEKVVMPVVGAILMARYPPARVSDPKDPLAFANGQLLLVRRRLYEEIGGHDAVVGEILEDVRLAERAKQAGARLLVVDGRSIARTRMYASWPEMRDGWSKNLFLLMDESPRTCWRWILTTVGLPWSVILAALWSGWPFGVVAYLVMLTAQTILRWRGSVAPRWAVLAPLGVVLTAAILLRSMRLHRSGRPVVWKARAYRR